jgi:hypothetical protein
LLDGAHGAAGRRHGVLATSERSGDGRQARRRMMAPAALAQAGGAAAALACLALACLALAGCSPSSSSSAAASPSVATTTVTATAPAASTSPPVTGPPACASSGLKVTQGGSDGYAGGVYVTLDFTNTSGAACTLYGYPGVSLTTASPYNQIGLAAKRVTTRPVKVITLAPGAVANASLQIVDALNFPASTCSPVKAANLRVFPPNQTASFYLPNTSQTCSKPVQTLFITAVQAGPTSSS